MDKPTLNWNKGFEHLTPDEVVVGIKALMKDQIQREDANLWFVLGNNLWKLGRNSEAISAFKASVDIDPDGPGKTALEMANQITEFFNPDLMNP